MLPTLLRYSILFSLPIAISALLVNLFFFPGGQTVLFAVGPITATAEGLSFAIEILARIAAISGAITLFYLTTKPAELVLDLERRGVSPRFAFVANASVQTVPAMAERAQSIVAAQRARGLDTEGSFWRRVRGLVPIVGPVVLGSITEVEERSMTLEARAFNRPGKAVAFCGRHPTPAGNGSSDGRWSSPWLALVGGANRGVDLMLTLEKVSYRYPGAPKPSLTEIDLALSDGEVVGLVGASESGKTTLALVASGLAPRSIGGRLEGRLLIDGEDVAGRPMYELAARVGICFQNPTTQLSQVADTVYRGGRLRPSEPRSRSRGGRQSERRRLWKRWTSAPLRNAIRAVVGWPDAARRGGRPACHAPSAPRPRRADSAARPRGQAAGRRCSRRLGRKRHGAADRRARHRPVVARLFQDRGA